MQSVTSNAVNGLKIFVMDTLIGEFTLSSNQTVSPNITQFVHEPPDGYSRLCSLYSKGQNYFQLSMAFDNNNNTYATITNHYSGTLTTDIRLFEIFMKTNLLP